MGMGGSFNRFIQERRCDSYSLLERRRYCGLARRLRVRGRVMGWDFRSVPGLLGLPHPLIPRRRVCAVHLAGPSSRKAGLPRAKTSNRADPDIQEHRHATHEPVGAAALARRPWIRHSRSALLTPHERFAASASFSAHSPQVPDLPPPPAAPLLGVGGDDATYVVPLYFGGEQSGGICSCLFLGYCC